MSPLLRRIGVDIEEERNEDKPDSNCVKYFDANALHFDTNEYEGYLMKPCDQRLSWADEFERTGSSRTASARMTSPEPNLRPLSNRSSVVGGCKQ
jgi:hypothetical protein